MRQFAITIFLLISCAVSFAQNKGTLKGKVRNLEGKSLADVIITARKEDKEVSSAKTNQKGEFVMSLEEGKYTLFFTKKGYSLGILYNVEVNANRTKDLGDRLILDVDRGTLVIIKGSVFNKDGLSIPEAKVEIERILPDGTTKKIGTVYTTESGEFTFRFPEGEAKFRIKASKNGVSADKEISVNTAAVYRLSLILHSTQR